jgi:hypothetical protein
MIEMIGCQSLYNLLNEGIEFAKIGDPYYLYLLGYLSFSYKLKNIIYHITFLCISILQLDCRSREEYNESHILCAKNIKQVIFVIFNFNFRILSFSFKKE